MVAIIDWKAKRLFKNNKLVARSPLNASLYIDNLYSDLFGYDINNETVYIINRPPWLTGMFKPRMIQDSDIINMRLELEQYGLRISFIDLRQVIRVNAERTPYKPELIPRSAHNILHCEMRGNNWLEQMNELTHGEPYAYPDNIMKVMFPGEHGNTVYRRTVRLLRKLGFHPISEWLGQKHTKRWKRISPPTEL